MLAISLLSLATVACAQSSTVSLLLLDTDPQKLVASVVEANPTSTVYVLNCPDGTDSNDCGTFNEWVTAGENFYAMNMTEGDFSATWSCDVAGTTSASCSQSFGGAEANDPGTTTTELSASEITYYPVVITAGAQKLNGAATATAAPASNSASSTGASATVTSAAILFPEVDPKQLAASVVSAGPSTTIYQIDCATGENKNESCPFGADSGIGPLKPWITMGGQSFFGANFSQAGQEVTLSCTVSSTSSASCVERLSESVQGSGTMTTALTTEMALSYGSVTITGGAEKLASATGASGSGSGSGASGSSASSTGAAPRETGGLGLLAMAAVAGAVLV
ncbi:hypothetical protein NA57DRAFT_55858 [Rhizodiscina lignyota]|uniref:Uncharacterized protein n=1 Tax=Rhizodiscina lignyota TaxID=1504668 RepID=A0A9P4MBP4_9PEZI|nr:hypothetical protein NA57DRAFT_55858 [Rhizodiscina lignyota]